MARNLVEAIDYYLQQKYGAWMKKKKELSNLIMMKEFLLL